jgi:hypothetical protein
MPINYLETALAMQIAEKTNERLSTDAINKMELTLMDEGNVMLTDKIQGHSREFIFSKELVYAPISYVRYDSDGRISMQMEMKEFKNVDGLILPYKIESKSFSYTNGKQYQTQAVIPTTTVQPERSISSHFLKYPFHKCFNNS